MLRRPRDQAVQLAMGVASAALLDQRTRVGDEQLGPRLRSGQMALDQGFGLGFAAAHQLQPEQGRPLRGCVGLLAQGRGRQRTGLVAGLQTQPADAGPGRRRQRRLAERAVQRALDHACGLGLVGHALVERGQRRDEAQALGLRQGGQEMPRRLLGLGHPTEHDQHLQLVLAGLGRIRERLSPGPRGFQCRRAGARLDGKLGGALEQGLVARAPGRVQHVGGALLGLALARQQLGQQQLVQQPGVQTRGLGHARLGSAGLWCSRSLGGGRPCRTRQHRPAK